MENAEQPIDLSLHVQRRLHDVGLEQGIDFTLFTGCCVDVVNVGGEDFVATVLRPRLREAFKFDIGGCGWR